MKILGRELTTEEIIGFVECQKEAKGMDKCQSECMIFATAVELAEIAKKQIPQKPELYTDTRLKYTENIEVYTLVCPTCGAYLCDVSDFDTDLPKYCSDCGQAIAEVTLEGMKP
jgi:hypothetical protein